MSSLTIMDLEFAFDLLAALLSESPQTVQVSEQELAAQRERERLENEARLRALERRDAQRYEAQLEAIERQKQAYMTAVRKEREEAMEALSARLDSLRNTAAAILAEAAAAGSSFLSNYANAAYHRQLFETLAARRQQIVDEAQAIIDDADGLKQPDIKAAELEARIKKLRDAWNRLNESLLETGEEERTAAERLSRFAAWLNRLDADYGVIQERIRLFPEDTPKDRHAAKERAMMEALRNVEQYLYSPAASYLTAKQKADVARLYGVRQDGADLELPKEDVEARNLRFDASFRRGLDREIFEMRTKLRRAQDRYRKLCERLGVPPEQLENEAGDAQGLLEALNEKIDQMELRFAARARREVVEAVVDRAIRSAKRGLSVRQLEAAETSAGNWSAMYQLGHSGTTLAVYADARGQISIESGGLLEGDSDIPTPAQSAAIERNNKRFCSSELPDIVERLREELEQAGDGATVSVRELHGPDKVNVFRGTDAKNAIVLKADGSAAATGATAAAVQQTKYMEADS